MLYQIWLMGQKSFLFFFFDESLSRLFKKIGLFLTHRFLFNLHQVLWGGNMNNDWLAGVLFFVVLADCSLFNLALLTLLCFLFNFDVDNKPICSPMLPSRSLLASDGLCIFDLWKWMPCNLDNDSNTYKCLKIVPFHNFPDSSYVGCVYFFPIRKSKLSDG